MTEFWNANNPDIAGTEVFPTRTVPRPLVQGLRGVQFLSTAAETITSVRSYFHARQADSSGGTVQVGVDIYESDDIDTPISGAIAVPGEVNEITFAFGASTWQQCSPGPSCADTDSSAYTFVDEPVCNAANIAETWAAIANYLEFTNTGGASTGRCSFRADSGTWYDPADCLAGTDPTGQRIAYIEVMVLCINTGSLPIRVDGLIDVAGSRYRSETGEGLLRPGQFERYVYRWRWNPASGEEWCAADLTEFMTGGANAFGAFVDMPTLGSTIRIGSVEIAFWTMDEKRVATGYANLPTDLDNRNGWRQIALRDPDDHSVANWSKADTVDYTLLWFITGRGGLCDQVGLDSSNADLGGSNPRPPDWYEATFPSNRAIPTPGETVTLGLTVPSLLLRRSDTDLSFDAQPYVYTRGHEVANGETAWQQISTEGTTTYGVVTVVVGRLPAAGTALEVRLRKVSDDSLLAGPVDIDAADVPADGKAHVVKRRFPSAASLTAGEDVYVEMKNPGTGAWLVYGIYHREFDQSITAYSVSAAALQGVGGIVDIGAVPHEGVTNGDTTLDVLASIVTAPADLTGLTATVETITQTVSSDPAGPLEIEYALLGWDASALGGSFDHYEIQRRSVTSGSFETIALITEEDSDYYPDVELPRMTAIDYRIRVHNTLGSFSDWSTFSPITVTTPEDCSLVLASNMAPDLTLGYLDEPGHAYQRANSGSLVVDVIEGRAKPVAFRPLIEGESDIFARRLVIAINNAAAAPFDRAPFDPLVSLIESDDVVQVVVCDGRGRQWYTAPDIKQMLFDQPGDAHYADVTFTEVDGPVVHTVDVPWAP